MSVRADFVVSQLDWFALSNWAESIKAQPAAYLGAASTTDEGEKVYSKDKVKSTRGEVKDFATYNAILSITTVNSLYLIEKRLREGIAMDTIPILRCRKVSHIS